MPFIINSTEINGLPVTTMGGCGSFSIAKTFDCGQTFRFDPVSQDELQTFFPDSASVYAVAGTALRKTVMFAESLLCPGEVTVVNASPEDCLSRWIPYLALDADYDAIDRSIENALPTEEYRTVMKNAAACGKGIRILRQDPWEAVISFIISQNNNIPRIKKIIAALCKKFGEETDFPGTYAFPSAETLCRAGIDGLADIRTGFRAKYIMDAAEKVSSGKVDLAAVQECSDFNTALAMLTKINGIGPKVGSCALLFGFGRTEAFPIDVWMKKSLARHFPDGIDVTRFGKYAGIAQQYLFYYERYQGGN